MWIDHDSDEVNSKTNSTLRVFIVCGVAGIWRGTSSSLETIQADIDGMLATLTHRGPDSHSTWRDNLNQVFLGHSRLSIVDLSKDGEQPMTSASGRYVVSFNGEIYNHKLLRRELEKHDKDLLFRGHSDTEVMLAAFDRWGVKEALSRCNGMFAIAIWDQVDRTLILARDRFGEKPLLYGWTGSGDQKRLVFASELRSFLALPNFPQEISQQAFDQYLGLGVVPDDTCILRGVNKVSPASVLYFKNCSERPIADSYWTLSENLVAPETRESTAFDNPHERVIETENLLETAVAQQLIADVPVGIFLSGGVDSSLIAALAQKNSPLPISTFSIGFDDPEIDESAHAALVAQCLKTRHHSLKISDQDLLDVIPSLANVYDEPFSDSSQIPTVLLSRLAREQITVALTGDGADELFFGYSRYFRALSWWSRFGNVPLPLRSVSAKVASSLPHVHINAIASYTFRKSRLSRAGEIIRDVSPALASKDLVELHLAIANGSRLQTFGRASIPKKHLKGNIREDLMLSYSDLSQYLPSDILVKTDRAAMSASLETRSPFLDVSVAEHALSLPPELKWQGPENKWVLRKILSNYVPPSISSRPKRGFDVPLAQWLRGPLKDWGAALIESRYDLSELGLHPKRVKKMWDLHQKGTINYHEALWPIIMFGAWSEHHLRHTG